MKHQPTEGAGKASKQRQPLLAAQRVNWVWGMDFLADNLFDGRKLRMLTVVDCYSRKNLAIRAGQSLKGEVVVQVLSAIVAQRGRPHVIRSDNGSEFVGKATDRWAYENCVELDFSGPGKPTDNAMVESSNGRLRQECLNEHWFMSLADTETKIEAWRRHYNESRLHSALDWMTTLEFARCKGPRPAASTDEEPGIPTIER